MSTKMSKVFSSMVFLMTIGACFSLNGGQAKADVVIGSEKSVVLQSADIQTKNVIKVPDRSEERRKAEEERRKAELAKQRASRGSSSAARYSDRTTYNGSGSDIVEYSYNFIGRPYIWAAEGPNSFDCSGFTQYVYKHFGIYLPHYTGYQVKLGKAVSRSNLRAGDLIFFNTTGAFSHVGIYIGSNKFIHASSGKHEVTISSLSNSYYNTRYAGARRIVE